MRRNRIEKAVFHDIQFFIVQPERETFRFFAQPHEAAILDFPVVRSRIEAHGIQKAFHLAQRQRVIEAIIKAQDHARVVESDTENGQQPPNVGPIKPAEIPGKIER